MAADFAVALARPAKLVSVMLANNETGVLQDIPALAEQARAVGGRNAAWFHTDAVQALGKVKLDFRALNAAGVNALTVSAHKLYGPQGAAALVLDKRVELKPLISGGGQERNLRSGTENVAAIVGFGAACELATARLEADAARLTGLRDMLERVGFGTATGTGFPGERSGVLPNHRIWHDIETATLSYGYGLSVTALQLASAYTTLVSGGIKKPVSMLKLSPESLAALPTEHVISEDIAHNVMSALETVVDKERGGGATAANVPYYSVAGKTGTAHVVGASGYESHIYNSLFVGYAPASDPRIVVVIIMNEPGGNEHYGSQVAAPLFSKIVTGAMRILNVTPDRLDDAQLLELSAL